MSTLPLQVGIRLLCMMIASLAYVTAVYPQSKSIEPDSTEQPPSAADILTGNTKEAKQRIVRKFEFLNKTTSIIASSLGDSKLDFEIKSNPNISLFLAPEELQDIVPQGPDPLGDELRRRFSDIPPTVPLNQMLKALVDSFKKKAKKPRAGDIVIPTDLEIAVLKELWQETEPITSSDIYAKLDTVWRITSEDLQAILEEMTERGFLERKKVSPSHEFGLFGIAQLELSAKNRKNKLYVYWPVFTKEELITFVDAKRYLAYEQSQKVGANGNSTQYYRVLEEKLLRLLQ